MCMIRSDFHENINVVAETRNESSYNIQINEINQNSNRQNKLKKQTEYGIKKDCVLNKTKNFHVTNNCVFDPMHDILEGAAPLIINSVIQYFVNKKTFTIKYLNYKIQNFNHIWSYEGKK